MNAVARTVVVLSTLLAVGAFAQVPRPPSGNAYPSPPAPALECRTSHLDERLQRAQAALEFALERRGEKKRALREALEEIYAARAELNGHSESPITPQPPRAMREDAFNALVFTLDRELNPEDQLRILSDAAEGNLFQASQAQTVLSRFGNDAFRLRAAGLLTRRLVDPGNAFILYAQLNGSFDKQVLQQLIAGGDANALVVAANDVQLRALSNAVFQPWNPADRLAALSARAGDQLLTTSQLRRLLDGFSMPRDRLLALQAMKRRLVDPRNCEVLTQAFWNPQDQNEARRLLNS